ncbi:MAG: trypsin-like peptidase domain-containing protein [Ginsengibacter sp.]
MKEITLEGGGFDSDRITKDVFPEPEWTEKYPTPLSTISSRRTTFSGTGFAITRTGFIVTNYHVVGDANTVTVKGINGNFSASYKAKVIVLDKINDLAIIQINDNKFPGIFKIPYLISTNRSNVGENVFVLGYPLRAMMGEEIKLTNGIISSKTGFHGDITTYQVSAPVQPGNSGGPLFDEKGNLIGIIKSIYRGAENVSYAIKIDYLQQLIKQLPITPALNKTNRLKKSSLSGQVQELNKFVYIIECTR